MIRYALENEQPERASPFENLIQPVTPEAFFADIWDQELLFVEGAGDHSVPVIELDQFSEALFEAGLGCKDIAYLHPSEASSERNLDTFFRIKANWKEAPSVEQLARELDGGTLVFNWLERRVPGAREWCQEIFRATGCRTRINGYFSSGQSANAFGAHFDTSDVFVIHVAGEKDWLLWEKDSPEPARGHGEDLSDDTPPDEVIRLSRGDRLYLPKHRWHWPKTAGTGHSFHLSVTVKARTAKDILNWLEHALNQQTVGDAPLPMSRYESADAAAQDELARVISLLEDQLADPEMKNRAIMHLTAQNLQTMHAKVKL